MPGTAGEWQSARFQPAVMEQNDASWSARTSGCRTRNSKNVVQTYDQEDARKFEPSGTKHRTVQHIILATKRALQRHESVQSATE